MSSDIAAESQRVLEALQKYGLLLGSDAQLPSVVSIVAGRPIRGSWWGHPLGNVIFKVASQLAEQPDILVIKLISGKLTYIHRRLWSALLGVATAREAWQLQNLSELAQALFVKVTQADMLRTDELQALTGIKSKAWGDAARQLERNLLVYSKSMHTSAGAHTKYLETWRQWASRNEFSEKLLAPDVGKMVLEDALLVMNMQFEAKGRLPWAN